MEPVQNEDRNDSITLQCFVSAVEQQQANLSQHIIDTFGNTMANINTQKFRRDKISDFFLSEY